jgi:hypothetical protein
MVVKNALNIAMILTLIPAVLRLVFKGEIGVEQAALMLVVGVFFIAGGKPLVKIVSAIAGLYLFSREITGGIGVESVFGQLLALAIVLIGFYVMFRPLFPRSWKNDDE